MTPPISLRILFFGFGGYIILGMLAVVPTILAQGKFALIYPYYQLIRAICTDNQWFLQARNAATRLTTRPWRNARAAGYPRQVTGRPDGAARLANQSLDTTNLHH